jgi:alkylation response protein AidB-like acyl-CoA dehydrogenase
MLQKWITNGIWSQYFTTAVRTSGKPGDIAGVSILLIERGEGVSTRKMKMGGQVRLRFLPQSSDYRC